MQIKEAKIFNFGKLQNRNFTFKDGINVIFGENEHGKTTLHAFLTGMLFGMEKTRGRAGKEDGYQRYEPWHAPSYYSGALRFTVGGQPFYLERNFYSKEKSEYLRNEADGEELNVAYGDLDMLLGGIGREEFGNTYDIPQSGAMTGHAMSELLANYLAEAEAGSDGKIHVLEAGKNLLARKKELLAEEKLGQEEKAEKIARRKVEADIIKENVSELRAQIRKFEEEQQELAKRLTDRREKRKQRFKTGIAGTILMGIVLAVCMVLYLSNQGRSQVLYVSIGAGILLTGAMFLTVVSAGKEKDEALSHAQAMLSQMKERLQESENELVNIKEELEELELPSASEEERRQDIEALELARMELERLSEEYYLEVADNLNAEISKWVSLLTNGTYDSARLGKDGRLWIVADNREMEPEALSRGTLEQIYLALRLAVGSVVMQEEDMPIFLDEAFAMYDDTRLAETLKALSKTGKQIFIFTCQKRECGLLEQGQIPYHLTRM